MPLFSLNIIFFNSALVILIRNNIITLNGVIYNLKKALDIEKRKEKAMK